MCTQRDTAILGQLVSSAPASSFIAHITNMLSSIHAYGVNNSRNPKSRPPPLTIINFNQDCKYAPKSRVVQINPNLVPSSAPHHG